MCLFQRNVLNESWKIELSYRDLAVKTAKPTAVLCHKHYKINWDRCEKQIY